MTQPLGNFPYTQAQIDSLITEVNALEPKAAALRQEVRSLYQKVDDCDRKIDTCTKYSEVQKTRLEELSRRSEELTAEINAEMNKPPLFKRMADGILTFANRIFSGIKHLFNSIESIFKRSPNRE